MGLFDFLKKKQPAAEQSQANNNQQTRHEAVHYENRLEEALHRAAHEPAFRPEFYRLLLSEDLIALTADNNIPEGGQITKEDTEISLLSLNGGVLPVFTSMLRVGDAKLEKETPVIAMEGRAFLEMTRGAKLVINPFSGFGKELLPDEVERLLDGTILSDAHNKITVEKDTKVLLAQPQHYPTEMVNSLKIVLANQPSVKKAYLALMSDGSEAIPHLVIAIDADTNDFESVINEAGFTAQQYLQQGEYEYVNFLELGNSGMDDYFINETEPFYVR